MLPMALPVPQSGDMENHLDPRLASGVRIGDLIIVSAIPHTKLPQTWAVTGRRDDGTFST